MFVIEGPGEFCQILRGEGFPKDKPMSLTWGHTSKKRGIQCTDLKIYCTAFPAVCRGMDGVEAIVGAGEQPLHKGGTLSGE